MYTLPLHLDSMTVTELNHVQPVQRSFINCPTIVIYLFPRANEGIRFIYLDFTSLDVTVVVSL